MRHNAPEINVSLIVSRPIIRYSFRLLLQNVANVAVIEECDNSLQSEKTLMRTAADIVIIDATIENRNVYEMIARYKRVGGGKNKAYIIVHLDESTRTNSDILLYMKSGASAIISPNQSIDEILVSLKKTICGESHIPNEFTEECNFLRVGSGASIDINLSPREQEVLKLIIAGGTSRSIALSLSLSIKTVECHRANLRKKFNVSNVVELINKSRFIGFR